MERISAQELVRQIVFYQTANHRARIIDYQNFDKDEVLECPVCGWKGTSEGHIEYYDDLFDVSCPLCEKMLLIVQYPRVEHKS